MVVCIHSYLPDDYFALGLITCREELDQTEIRERLEMMETLAHQVHVATLVLQESMYAHVTYNNIYI